MKTVWEYVKTDKGIRILKVYGDTVCPGIPEEIDGCPVTEIGPYAFSASEVPRRFRPVGLEVRRYVKEEGMFQEPFRTEEETDVLPEPVHGSKVKAVELPDTVETIGDYAFYGCTGLSKLSFTDTLKRIGSGAFMGCSAVREFIYKEKKDGKKTLAQMLSELRYAIHVEIRKNDKKICLVFPEYFEMSVENVPARIFEIHTHGTGYRYRQCFHDGKIDYRSYDELFSLAVSQDPSEVVARLAYNRLRFPEELSEEAKKTYLDYFSSHVREAGEIFLKEDDLEAVRLIAEAGGFDGKTGILNELQQAASDADRNTVADGPGDFYIVSLGEGNFGKSAEEDRGPGGRLKTEPEEALDVLTAMASRMGRTECLGFLMDYRHKKQGTGGKKKVFDL